MATLIPSFFTCSQRITSGERRFAQRLESNLEDDYLLWYDVPVGCKWLDPDFIVLHPCGASLFWRCKDWKLSTIQSLDPDNAIFVTLDGCKANRKPLRQARDYTMAIASRKPVFQWTGSTRLETRAMTLGKPASSMVTMHSSRGLEFPVVLIPGLGYLPYAQAFPEDEAQLLYMAMTRAIDPLVTTGHQSSAFVRKVGTVLEIHSKARCEGARSRGTAPPHTGFQDRN